MLTTAGVSAKIGTTDTCRESAKSGRPAAARPLATAYRPARAGTPAHGACNSRDSYNFRGGCNNRDKATFWISGKAGRPEKQHHLQQLIDLQQQGHLQQRGAYMVGVSPTAGSEAILCTSTKAGLLKTAVTVMPGIAGTKATLY